VRSSTLFHGAALFGAVLAVSGCAPHAASGLPASAPAAPGLARTVRTPAALPTIRVTEPDATVATSLAPLVEAAGPASLFVPVSGVRCPEGMALVAERVCIDRWEAHLVSLEAPAGARKRLVDRTPYEAVDGAFGFRAASGPGTVPQGYISGRQAEAACRAAGKRLCTATEWERGCRGPKNLQFPYGNERTAKVCNDDVRERHPVLEASRLAGVRSDRVWMEGMNLPAINQLEGGLEKTGAREGCVTSEGLFDMVGNLHEWVADADGTFRGGYYMDTSRNGDGCSYQTTAHDFDYHDYSTGFRCCADPEPVE
jgi:sulfatase modifying factor 1